MFRMRCWLAAILAGLLSHAAQAQDPADLARRFGARADVLQISLSPLGKQIAYIAPAGHGERVMVVDVDKGGEPRPVLAVDQPGGHLTWCKWPTETQLICNLRLTAPFGDTLIGWSRLYVINASYKATDGTAIPAYLTLPPGVTSAKGLPAIVMPHGGPEARDEWGFDWMAQFYAQRGFAVLQPNFRGSAGYGEAWMQNENGFKAWKVAIGDVSDAGRWLVSQGIADPNKLAVVGWSYGGYAALQVAATSPDVFKAVVAIAPVADLDLLRNDARHFTNFKMVSDFIGHGANVDEGSPTKQAGNIVAPVMLVHGTIDEQVDEKQSELMQNALQHAGRPPVFLKFDGLGHSLSDSAARIKLLSESDAFLRKSLGMN